jgi:hypothetical protein
VDQLRELLSLRLVQEADFTPDVGRQARGLGLMAEGGPATFLEDIV